MKCISCKKDITHEQSGLICLHCHSTYLTSKFKPDYNCPICRKNWEDKMNPNPRFVQLVKMAPLCNECMLKELSM